MATHSLRKTFAQRCFDACGDIYQVSELLGHKDVETTKLYIGISYTKLQQTVKDIEVYNNIIGKTLHSDSDLIAELLSQGSSIPLHRPRGVNMESAIEQMQAERRKFKKSKVIPFPKSQAF